MGFVIQVVVNPAAILSGERNFIVHTDIFHHLEYHIRGLERKGAALEVKALSPEPSGVSTGCDMGFEDGDFVAFFCQKITGNKAAHARTDYGYCAHVFPLIIVGGRISGNGGGVKLAFFIFL